MNSLNAGGAAAQAGINYQNRVAAWLAVRILAERDATPLWGLSAASTLEFLRCETEQPVDDVMVGTSDGGHAFIQVKRSLNVESAIESRLGSAVTQFVRQLVAYRNPNEGSRSWERPLEAQRDRLVLVTSSRSPASVRDALPSLLSRASVLDLDQPIEGCATTVEERRVLDTLLTLFRGSWERALGTEPPDRDLRQMFRLLRVQVLDLENDGAAEREAKYLLRHSAVRNAIQADNAWSTLLEVCSGYATSRSGADRSQLQKVLATHDIQLNIPRSYRDDVARLREYSAYTLRSVADLSVLHIGNRTVKIDRPSAQIMRDEVESASLLVVGDPGAGKSGVLHDLVETLQADNRDVIFFAVDRTEARSLGGLRDELGLTHEIDEVLRNWPDERPAFLVIDALDAARNDQSAQTLRNLLTDTLRQSGRWRVVASIRKFDLQYDSRLKKLFEGRPVSNDHSDSDFWNTRHLNIRVLSPEELTDACRQSPELLGPLVASIIEGGHNDLLALLRNPFNLRLVGDLLGSGIQIDTLTPIRTQLELLDRYWQERVILSRSQSQGDAREVVLRCATETMVATRSLRADRATLASDASAGTALRDLQSSHVLADWRPSPEAEPNRYVITFAHHILFDYAVARLLLRGTGDALVRRFEADEELAVAIRPSLTLHFQHEWESDIDRHSFWSLVFRFMRSVGIPEIGKLIGPAAASELIKGTQDFQPLIEHLENPDASLRNEGEQALRHLTRTILVTQGNPLRPLVGELAPPWCELLDQSTRRIEETGYTIRSLLMRLCDLSDGLTGDQKAALGRVARQLLDYAWAKEGPPDQYLIVHAIQAVCCTFESDFTASSAILHRSIDPTHLTNYAYIELPWLAQEVERLVQHDPELVEGLYSAAFSHEEESRELMEIGGSRILPLTETRSQAYTGATWLLAANYRKFLEKAPLPATRALIAAVDTYVAKRHRGDERAEVPERFDFDGQEAMITTDYSDIWDSGAAYRDDPPLRMLDTFDEYLRALSSDESTAAECAALLELIVQRNRYAVIWKRLLDCGAEAPNTLGLQIRFLGWAMPVLTGYDTTSAVGDYLHKVFALVETQSRERIERAILSISAAATDADQLEALRQKRNRLLWCLPSDALVTAEAIEVFQELQAQGGGPPNERLGPGTYWGGQVTDEDLLARQGVPVEAEPNRRIQELIRPIQTFVADHLNAKPRADDIAELTPKMQSLFEALTRAEENGVHPKQRENGEDYLIEACEKIAGSDELVKSSDELRAFTRQILLNGSTNPKPEYRPENDPYFDEHPSWGIPSPRVDAAGGLIWLAREPEFADPELLGTIERLSHDELPAVRFQIASRLNSIYYTAPDLMWQIIEQMCRKEQSRGVLEGLLNVPLSLLAGPHADRTAYLTQIIFERVRQGNGAAKIRSLCTEHFCALYVWRDHGLAREMVFRIANDPLSFPDEAHKITFELRRPLTVGFVDPCNADEDAVRRRAFDLMGAILHSTTEPLSEFQTRNSNTATWTSDDHEQAKILVRLTNSIAQELFFASGAFDKEMGGSDTSRPPLGDSEKSRFFQEASPLLDALADIGVASIAHNLVKTLEYLLEYDPAQVFLKIARAVRASKAGQYQYESLAVDVIVRIVKRFLAAYQYLLRERQDCRHALIEILDIFVAAGWPAALELTYRLEEIYR
jgi:hypothetical protein